MVLKNLRMKLNLVSVRSQILKGNFPEARKRAGELTRRFPEDAQAIMLLADSELFLRNLEESREMYKKADRLLERKNLANEESRKFLRAYISYRLLELGFLVDKQNKVAKPRVVDDINNIPAGTSSKALFFLDSSHAGIPRLYGSRRGQAAGR